MSREMSPLRGMKNDKKEERVSYLCVRFGKSLVLPIRELKIHPIQDFKIHIRKCYKYFVNLGNKSITFSP